METPKKLCMFSQKKGFLIFPKKETPHPSNKFIFQETELSELEK